MLKVLRIEKIDNNIKLLFKPGEGEIEYNESTNTVIVYTTTFKEEVVKPTEKTKRLKKIEKKSQIKKKGLVFPLDYYQKN